MKYKIGYSPTYVLDPDSYDWLALDEEMLAKFDERGYLNISLGSVEKKEPSQLEESTEAEDQGADEPSDNQSLFTSGMPGMMSSEEVTSLLDLDRVFVRLSRGFFYAGDLLDWENESIENPSTAKSVVAGMLALIGTDLLPSTCLDFRRSG